jgi:importin subunit beta-1
MDVSQILANASSSDPNVMRQAEQQLQAAEQHNLAMYFHALVSELVDESKSKHTRALAGMLIKNRLDSKDDAKRAQYATEWVALDAQVRANVKAGVLQSLSSGEVDPRNAATQVCAKIAQIELPRGLWPELIQILLNNMTQSQNDFLKQSTLQTLGYICEEIDPQVIQDKSNQILTAVVQGMRADEKNNAVKLSAAKALDNALEFAKANFENQDERNYIMSVVFECTQSTDQKVKVAGFECLVKIASLYYAKLPQYMQQLFNVTLESIKSGAEPVALQAIEFWSTICDEELYLMEEIADDNEMGVTSTVVCHNFIKGAYKFVVPLLLECLTKQDEDADEDTWGVSMAGATCLNLVANVLQDEIIETVVPFVQKFLGSPDWHFKEAAVMAFGSILEGATSAITNLIREALPPLVGLMNDPNEHVKDTAVWTVGRVCQLHPLAIRGEAYFNPILQALVVSMKDIPKVSANACWALSNVAEAFEDEDTQPADKFLPYFLPVITALWGTVSRSDVSEDNLRAAGFEAINAWVKASSTDCVESVSQLVPEALNRLNNTFAMQILSTDDKDAQLEEQGLLCGLLQTCIQKLETGIKPFADSMFELFLRVLSGKGAAVHEEAFMAIGALANALEGEFEKYMPAFRPYLLMGLRNHEEYTVCSVSVGVVGDVSRAIQRKLLPYCDDILTILLENLQNTALNRTVKPPILSCFGDIGLAICGEFQKYLGVVMTMLLQATTIQVDTRDDELVEYLNQLREGIFEAYTGILQGLRTDNQADHFLQHVPYVVNFVGHVYQDATRSDAVTRGAIGVLGDIAHALGAKAKPQLHQEFVRALVQECTSSDSDATREVAQWTQEVIQKL